MAFRAIHEQWGVVFSHLPDLGCGRDWQAVWKSRPLAPLTCAECGHRVLAKTSRLGLRFFAHAPGASSCASSGESIAHHLFKLELAQAARRAGADAELEVRAASGAWRADVLARTQSALVALEAQLAPITEADLVARTARMSADGVASCWFTDRLRPPWLGAVPSVRLAAAPHATGLAVVEGLVRFTGGGWAAAAPVELHQFLSWLFTGQVVPHRPRTRLWHPLRPMTVVWTAPAYARVEDRHLVEVDRRRQQVEEQEDRQRRARERRRSEIARRNAISWAEALHRATVAETTARSGRQSEKLREETERRPVVAAAVRRLAEVYGIKATVGWSISDRQRYACGVPLVDDAGTPVAVIAPDPQHVRGEAFPLLAGLLILFPSNGARQVFLFSTQRRRIVPAVGYRTDTVGHDVPERLVL